MKNIYMTHCPQTFDEVVGQPTITKELKARAADGNFSQNIFFTGDSGTGKTTLGRIVAKRLLCENPQGINPCNACPVCTSINEQRTILQYQELNGSDLGKDEVAELVESSKKRTALSKNKNRVILITEAQLIKSEVAQKNLLVALQGSVPYLYWIFDSMDASDIHDALMSRFTVYNLRSINVDDMQKHLVKTSGVKDEKKLQVIETICNSANGSMRQALSYLERVMYGELWNSDSLYQELGIQSQSTIDDILSKLCKHDAEALRTKISKEMVEQMSWKCLNALKHKKGYRLERWQLPAVSFAKDLDHTALTSLLIILKDIMSMPYQNQFVIESNLMLFLYGATK